jgi:hypothetical protein
VSSTTRAEALAGRTPLLLFLALFLPYAYFLPRWADWSQNARFALVQAIVEEHSFAIDRYYEQTGDYSVYRGHYYSGKAPGLSFLGAPVYALFRAVAALVPVSDWAYMATLQPEGSGLLEDKVEHAAALYLVTFFTVSLPSALLWLLAYAFLSNVGMPRRLGLAVVLACGLGTLAFPYSTVFYSHQTAAFLLFLSFYLMFLVKHRGWWPGYLWAVGGLLGLAVVTDFPSLLAAGLLVGYGATFLPAHALLPRVLGGALPMALLLGFYNYVCFDSPFASAYSYLALFPGQVTHGILGFGLPTWSAFWGITFSPYRGILFSTPFLLLMLPGGWIAWRSGRWRAEVVLALGVVAAYVALISSYYDWSGGFAVAGPRHLIPIIPFAALPVSFGLQAAWRIVAGRLFVVTTVAWSLAAAFIQTAAGQAFAPTTLANPLGEFFLPRLLEGDINRNLGMALGLMRGYSLLPIMLVATLIAAALWINEPRFSDQQVQQPRARACSARRRC